MTMTYPLRSMNNSLVISVIRIRFVMVPNLTSLASNQSVVTGMALSFLTETTNLEIGDLKKAHR